MKPGGTCTGERGYAMAALLVAMSVMAVLLSTALPVFQTMGRREREAELVFRGEQYARAIGLFQRKYGNALPPDLDVLLRERFLRKTYKDPITGGDFQLLGPGSPELAGALGAPPAQAQQSGRGRGAQATGGRGTQSAGRGALPSTERELRREFETTLNQLQTRASLAQLARETGGAPGGIVAVAARARSRRYGCTTTRASTTSGCSWPCRQQPPPARRQGQARRRQVLEVVRRLEVVGAGRREAAGVAASLEAEDASRWA